MRIRDLATHPTQYVTIAELAEYWAVSRQQIYKRIESGALQAIRFGLRLYRVRTRTALEYERAAAIAAERDEITPLAKASRPHPGEDFPTKIGFQRVRNVSGTK